MAGYVPLVAHTTATTVMIIHYSITEIFRKRHTFRSLRASRFLIKDVESPPDKGDLGGFFRRKLKTK